MNKFLNLAASLLLTALCAIPSSVEAQNKTNDEAAVLKAWDAAWASFATDDNAKMASFYAENACEIYPDGSSVCGKNALLESFKQFEKMLDGKPSFTTTKPTVHFIEPTVALLISEVTSDIKMGGQQIGGKQKFAAIMHKISGHWVIEFDSQTPILPPPPMPADSKK